MKKSLPLLLITLCFLSCSNSDTKDKKDAKDESSVGVQNVNGNIPDTTNAINIGTHKPNEIEGDSTKKDSLKK